MGSTLSGWEAGKKFARGEFDNETDNGTDDEQSK